MRAGSVSTVLSLSVVGALLTAVAPGHGVGARPDLTVKAVTAPAEARAGGTIAIRVTTRNGGRTKAGATTTKVYLSTDTRVGRDAATAAARVPGLRPGRSSSTTVRLKVPAGTPPRAYRVLACADSGRRVREGNEGNNCRVASRAVTVTAGDGSFPLDPDPVAASEIELESANAVTGLVDPADPASRTLVTTAADGTTYTLDFPAEALLTPERITMTPLASATVPILSGGFRTGVRLEPEGLLLHAPATLTITSPALGPIAQQTPYVFHEDGEDFHQHPVATPEPGEGADTVRFPLTHFSVAGVAGGTDADRAELAARPPVRTQAQAEAAIAEILREARETGDSGEIDRVIPIYEAYYVNVVEPLMIAAETDASLAQKAIYEGISVSRALQLQGREGHWIHDSVTAHIRRIVANAIEHYWKECSERHDLTAITTLVSLARAAAFLVGEELSQRAFDLALRCGRFEVEYDVTLDYDRDYTQESDRRVDVGHYRLHSQVEVPVFEPAAAPLSYTEVEAHTRIDYFPPFSGWSESTVTGTTPGALRAEITARANPIDPGPGDGKPAPPTPYVRIDPGMGADGSEQLPEETHRWTNSTGFTREEQSPSFYACHSMHWAWGAPWHELDLEHGTGSAVLLETTVEQSSGGVNEQFGRSVSSTFVRVTHSPDAG